MIPRTKNPIYCDIEIMCQMRSQLSGVDFPILNEHCLERGTERKDEEVPECAYRKEVRVREILEQTMRRDYQFQTGHPLKF